MARPASGREGAVRRLRKLLRPGTTVYTVLHHRSKSGMTQAINLYVLRNNRPVRITDLVAQALNRGRTDNGLAVSGRSPDIGFYVVYTLSRLLFPDGKHTLRQEW